MMAYHIKAVPIFLIIVRAHMNVLCFVKLKILILLLSYRSAHYVFTDHQCTLK